MPALPDAPELLRVLPNGYIIETGTAAEDWWRRAAQSIVHGKLMTIDYGHDASGLLAPGRVDGTLRAYRGHQLAGDVLACPGEQDITAHVDFQRIQSVGLDAGLATETFETQGRYLTRLAAEAWSENSAFGSWTPRQTRQFQTLTHPEHLGRSFRVLVQARRCSS